MISNENAVTVSSELLAIGRPMWEQSLACPFLQGIRDGSLPKEKFMFYMVQDYLYLKEYVKLFALGVVKSGDIPTMRYFQAYEAQILNTEMETHRSYMAHIGITPEEAENAETAPENQAYTDFMLARAWEGSAADAAVTVLACAESYEYIARRIIEEDPSAAEHPFYGEWVRSYGDPDYAASNRELEKLMDSLTSSASEADRRRFRDIFVKCTRCEDAFWAMGWRGSV